VYCDPADLDRIAVNLVGNAVKYTARGCVRVSLAMDDGRVRLEVADTGIGIPREALPYLFNEFYRAGNAKAAGSPGRGSAWRSSSCSSHATAATSPWTARRERGPP